MSNIIVSPTEPPELKAIGEVGGLPERYGCDVLVVARGQKIGVQRKAFPADLLASLADKRLYEQVHKMAELERKLIVFEGRAHWTEDGELIGDYQRFSKGQLVGLTFTLMFEHHIPVLFPESIKETVGLVQDLETWAKKKDHLSLMSRGGAEKNTWGVATNRAWQRHILQGFQGIGPKIADNIIDHFGRVPLEWAASRDEMMQVPGLGKGKVDKMMGALE